ncbi:MAG: hypothetical protein KHX03_09055 [Clostridium sp.]|nr:hypothetical protein [Clostridium sp.]
MTSSISSVSSAMADQTASLQMQVKLMSMQKQQGAIALSLLQGAINAVPQDPSTITSAQLKSPIDIRV